MRRALNPELAMRGNVKTKNLLDNLKFYQFPVNVWMVESGNVGKVHHLIAIHMYRLMMARIQNRSAVLPSTCPAHKVR